MEISGRTTLEPADLLKTSSQQHQNEGTQMQFSVMETDCAYDRKSRRSLVSLWGQNTVGTACDVLEVPAG